MSLVPDIIAQSFPLTLVFLFFSVFFRAQGTYWLGRAAAKGALRSQDSGGVRGAITAWFSGPIPQKGVTILERWGLIIIPLCFLTVGIQTAVNAGAGLVRMNWLKYTAAMIPGCIAWAFLYAIGLLAIWTALVITVAGSPWAWLALLLIVCALVAWRYVWRRHRRVFDEAHAE